MPSGAAPGGSASGSSDEERCLLLALSHDELSVIVDGLADPLQPIVAVALSSTCKGLRMPLVLKEARLVLVQRHFMAAALCHKMEMTCADLRDAEELEWSMKGLTVNDLATLAMILRTNGLPKLVGFELWNNGFGDAGMQVLCEGLTRGAVPSLLKLDLMRNEIGPAGAEALAAALHRGALPKLETLVLSANPISSQGLATLVAPLRKRALWQLYLDGCEFGDEGVASLVAGLGKDDFKALELLDLERNQLTDMGCDTLVAALQAGALPAIKSFIDKHAPSAGADDTFAAMCIAFDEALRRRLPLEVRRLQS
tara:strand:+ start:987 stop:1922 length:936 start_codon:yes stop_codon:yes gene_type:complete